MKWISVDKAKPESGRKVIIFYKNSHGLSRNCMSMWIERFTEEANFEDEQCTEYCEEKDTYYLESGWYECIDNWGDFSSVKVSEGDITHWMPLPEPPTK